MRKQIYLITLVKKKKKNQFLLLIFPDVHVFYSTSLVLNAMQLFVNRSELHSKQDNYCWLPGAFSRGESVQVSVPAFCSCGNPSTWSRCERLRICWSMWLQSAGSFYVFLKIKREVYDPWGCSNWCSVDPENNFRKWTLEMLWIIQAV